MKTTNLAAVLAEKLGEEGSLLPSSIARILLDVNQFQEFHRGSTGEYLDPDNLKLSSLDLAEWKGYLQRRGAKPATLQRKFSSLRKMVLVLAPGLMGQLRWP